MMHNRITAAMGELTTNPYYPFSTTARHEWCSSDGSGFFWWDNGEACPVQSHPDHDNLTDIRAALEAHIEGIAS